MLRKGIQKTRKQEKQKAYFLKQNCTPKQNKKLFCKIIFFLNTTKRHLPLFSNCTETNPSSKLHPTRWFLFFRINAHRSGSAGAFGIDQKASPAIRSSQATTYMEVLFSHRRTFRLQQLLQSELLNFQRTLRRKKNGKNRVFYQQEMEH